MFRGLSEEALFAWRKANPSQVMREVADHEYQERVRELVVSAGSPKEDGFMAAIVEHRAETMIGKPERTEFSGN